MSLNLAPSELCSGKGRALTQRLLEVTGRDPKLVFIELTERGLLEQNAKERIEELRALGVRIAIDDFGTGYSSLAYLASFSLDYLKLDKLFTQGIADKGPRRTVAIQIVELARSLDLDVIAEGVETIEQAMAVSTHGVAKAQGWLYGRAVPLDELLRRLPEGLRRRRARRNPSRGKCPPARRGATCCLFAALMFLTAVRRRPGSSARHGKGGRMPGERGRQTRREDGKPYAGGPGRLTHAERVIDPASGLTRAISRATTRRLLR